MNAQDWEKLRKNAKLLEREICVQELLDHLIEYGALPQGCQREYIDESKTNENHMKNLLKVLKGTPAKKEAFKSFLKALRACRFDYYDEIAKKIEETKTQADSSIFAKEDPLHYENKVRSALDKNFTEKKNASTTLKEIRSCLESKNAFGKTPWDNEKLKDFILNHFTKIEVNYQENLVSKKDKIIFRHLTRVNSKDVLLSQSVNETTGLGQERGLKTMSPRDLRAFLVAEFEKAKLSTSCLKQLEIEEVSGMVLLEMSESDINELMPSLSFGQKVRLKTIIREDTNKVVPKRKFQRLMSFDCELNPIESYGQGDWVDTSISTANSKLVPIRNFHNPTAQEEEETLNFILGQSAIFVTACINGRQNGTIYFGIAPEECGKSVKGQIEGLNHSIENFEEVFPNLFFRRQHATIKNVVRKLRRVPVKSLIGTENENRFVLELDVVPSGCLESTDKIKLNAEKMPCLRRKYKTSDPSFELSATGQPQYIPPELMLGNTKVPEVVLSERAREESEFHAPKQDAVSKLRNHLTGGSHTKDDEIYIFMLLGPLGHSTIDYKSIQFIPKILPDVVFDFERQGLSGGIFSMLEQEGQEELKVASLNDFNEREKSKQEVIDLRGELAESNNVNWVFCNEPKDRGEMTPTDWNLNRRQAFKKALSHYIETCRVDRILVVICLFLPNDILVEACEETLTDFPCQWILLSDSMSNVRELQQTFTARNKVRKEDLVDRCIVGLPWDQVNSNILSWCQQEDIDKWQIPHSNGGTVVVERKKINEWRNLELVSALDPCLPKEDPEAFEQRKKKAEEAFYCGEEVQWLNFYSDHVCPRTIQNDLNQMVHDALDKRGLEEEEKIACIYLFHEPGAGGSTSARQVLWTWRKKFRCCVVRKITDQTADHLMELFLFKEEKCSKPILVLLDHIEEEKLYEIRVSLAKKVRGNAFRNHAFFVLLICYRIVFVPVEKRKLSMVTLKQFLNKDEMSWFERRYADLKSRYDNPKSLISFNILKANFDKKYIRNTVKEFVEEIYDPGEETILKFVSLINTFDIDFNCVHVSCLDTVLESFNFQPVFQTSSSLVRKTRWESNVSQSFRVLFNLSSGQDQNGKQRKTIRVFNKLIAEHILNFITTKTGDSVGNLFLNLLNVEIFGDKSKDMRKLQSIISNIVKKRDWKDKSVKKEKFSPLIQSVAKKEGTERAGKIMEKLFELNEDPYSSQQVARFHIEHKNYERAEKFAKDAVVLAPDKSYLWDTYAQVFKAQLLNKVHSPEEREFTKTDFKELIHLCERCVYYFQKEQTESERETETVDGEVNLAGYYGQLESVELLIRALQKCKWLGCEKVIHKFFVNKKFTHENLSFLSPEEQHFLKTLWPTCSETLRKLDDNDLQVKVEIDSSPVSQFDNELKKKLMNIKVFFCGCFGERNETVPNNLSEEEKCLYRSRIVLFQRAGSLSDVLMLKLNGGISTVKKCFSLLLQNIQCQSVPVSMDDLRLITNIVTVLLIDGPPVEGLNFQLVCEWSQKFYQLSQTQNRYLYLEAFMFYAMYNFPTDQRMQFSSIGPIEDLILVLKHWKESMNEKRKWPRITHRDTTLFFLGIGPPMEDIVYQKSLKRVFVKDGTEFTWNSPKLCNILRSLQGLLLPEGEYIIYSYVKDGISHDIKIKTSQKITRKVLWRKQHYFYLGFSFSGLKAYGIQSTKLTQG